MKNVKLVENLGKQNAPHRFSGYVDLTLAEFEALQLAKLLVACALRISVGSSELIKGLTFADKFDGFKAFVIGAPLEVDEAISEKNSQ